MGTSNADVIISSKVGYRLWEVFKIIIIIIAKK